jgi:hypothetical protein
MSGAHVLDEVSPQMISAHPNLNKMESTKPFNTSYVLKTTVRHIKQDIDISIQKTFERIKDFDGNQDKSLEIFKALAILHTLRKSIDDFQSTYKEDFRGVQ